MAVQDRTPTGNSATNNQWQAGTGGNKYDEVDDHTSGDPGTGTGDDDTTYAQGAGGAATERQCFTCAAFSITSSAVEKVSVTIKVKKDPASSSGTLGALLRVGGTTYDGATAVYSDDLWHTATTDWTTNPKTAAAWTEADVEGTGLNPLQEFGVWVTGQSAGHHHRCTMCYASVTYTAGGGTTFQSAWARGANALIDADSGHV